MLRAMQWLYHLLTHAEAVRSRSLETYAPASLAAEGFVHASFASEVQASANLYFAAEIDVIALQIAPHRLNVPVRLDSTPRGLMPHIFGAITRDAIVAEHRIEVTGPAPQLPSEVASLSVAFLGFADMTLLDLVGVWDPLSRIATMKFDPTFRTTVITLAGAWEQAGMQLSMRELTTLAEFDAVVIAGGPSATELAREPRVQALLRTLRANRVFASVCTGALFLGELGILRGVRATTHASAVKQLQALGAVVEVAENMEIARVVDSGQIVTAGGVTAGIDLGLHLVARFYGATVASAIAARMNYRR
jgi:putative intracellular protease/amidase/uncharacterized protein (DUF952 family)